MTFAGLLAFLSSFLGLGGTDGATQQAVSRVVVQDELIVRVPVQPTPHFLEWEEHKGPRCIPVSEFRAAKLSGPRQVDFILQDRSRMRAELDDDCPALDFYTGLYLKPEDDRLCARRDSIRSRMGGSCRIERFRRLTPKLRH